MAPEPQEELHYPVEGRRHPPRFDGTPDAAQYLEMLAALCMPVCRALPGARSTAAGGDACTPCFLTERLPGGRVMAPEPGLLIG